MRILLPIAAAAFAISASGAANALPLKVDLKANQNVTKVTAKVPGTAKVKVMENPANLKAKVQVPGTGKVKVKIPGGL